MKKGLVINSEIARVIADLGHMDRLSIGDAGMPVPNGIKKIDLAVAKQLPSFIDVLKNVLSEDYVDHVILADEIKNKNESMLQQIKQVLGSDVMISFEPHSDLKKDLSTCKAFIRTGEMTPFSNIILCSGVTF